jgi:hypothetical protein
MRTKLNKEQSFKPSPNLDLKKAIGNKLIGIFKSRIEKPNYPGKYSALIQVIETNGSTTAWDKEKKEEVEVDIAEGDTVFLRENTGLSQVFKDLKNGDKIEVIYQGKGKAKQGQRPPFLYDVFLLGE